MFDQNSFHNPSVNASSAASILIIDHSQPTTRSVAVGMYPSIMGTFSFPVPVPMIGSSFCGASSSSNSVSFHTTHMEYPWIFPSLSTSSVPVETDMPLPATMAAYQADLN